MLHVSDNSVGLVDFIYQAEVKWDSIDATHPPPPAEDYDLRFTMVSQPVHDS